MTEPLHLLVFGELDSGVADSLRVGVYREPLAALGVEMRRWRDFGDDILNGGDGVHGDPEPLRAMGLTALAWADVILLRRWVPTHTICTSCELALESMAALEAHLRETGHRTMAPIPAFRAIVELLAAHPELLGSRAIVYDTDDDVLDYPAWTGFGAAATREKDVVLQVLRLATLVTAATPVLAERLAAHTRAPVRVVRNALDPAWYDAAAGSGAAAPTPAGDEVRLVYHGVPARFFDYEIARGAVDTLAAENAAVRRIWVGAAHEPLVVAAVDEVRPWVEGLAPFAAELTATRPSVGLAPLRDEPFSRAKSELHWLEYAAAGAPAVVSGFEGPGPFDVVRDGVDGLVARNADDWLRHLRALARSRDLRAGIADRARERFLAEYTVALRAHEWADAYRWAAEHGR